MDTHTLPRFEGANRIESGRKPIVCTSEKGVGMSQETQDNAVSQASEAPELVNSVIETAIDHFAELGFEEAKIEAIAKDSGMSKRMIHYHFGDKKGLYVQALTHAMSQLAVPDSELELDTSIPVEGVRKLIDAAYAQFVAYPNAARLLTRDSLASHIDLKDRPPLYDCTAMMLYLDRLLMLGQDAGAFRPGITSEDVYTLMASIMFFRQTNADMMANAFGVAPDSEENVSGVHRLLVDTILAFLTSNIPNSGQSSYLLSKRSNPQPDEGDEGFGGLIEMA